MQRKKPKLRGQKQSRSAVYPIGEIPEDVIHKIAGWLVYYAYVGHADLTGNDWGAFFAKAVGGNYNASNLDAHDVSLENCAWSAKTVKDGSPFDCQKVRFISGRNSPTYSAGITDPLKNPQETGRAVLDIWNGRIDRVASEFEDYRLLALVRNMIDMKFALFEAEITRFIPGDYKWEMNKRGNLEGRDASGTHHFTWQPSGSQFTIIKAMPASVVKFTINRPPTMDVDEVLHNLKFDKSWVKIHS